MKTLQNLVVNELADMYDAERRLAFRTSCLKKPPMSHSLRWRGLPANQAALDEADEDTVVKVDHKQRSPVRGKCSHQ